MNAINYLFEHRADIAAWLTYVMLSLVLGAHLLVGFARGARKVALASSWKWDDAPSLALLRFAETTEKKVATLSELHARLMPSLNPTPSLERAEADERLARARSQLGARGQ